MRCAIARIPPTSRVSQALEVVARVKPRQTYFTHICHDLPHAETNAALPASWNSHMMAFG